MSKVTCILSFLMRFQILIFECFKVLELHFEQEIVRIHLFETSSLISLNSLISKTISEIHE